MMLHANADAAPGRTVGIKYCHSWVDSQSSSPLPDNGTDKNELLKVLPVTD